MNGDGFATLGEGGQRIGGGIKIRITITIRTAGKTRGCGFIFILIVILILILIPPHLVTPNPSKVSFPFAYLSTSADSHVAGRGDARVRYKERCQMLEIFFVIGLCRRLGTNLRAKGRSAVGFQIMLVLFWFGMEIVGLAFGAALNDADGPNLGMYVCGLVGAAIGGGFTFLIASCVSPVVRPTLTYGFPVMPSTYPTRPYPDVRQA